MANSNRVGSNGFKGIGQSFMNSHWALRIGLVANALSVLSFVFCLLRIFSFYAVITMGVCILITIVAYGVLLLDILRHRTR